LVTNEIVDDLKREKKRGVIVKVDYEKTYDSMNLNFLYYMMRLGFNSKWVKLCLESFTILSFVNGSPTEKFKPKKRLTQGDPVAPFLFLIVVEGLARMVGQATRKNLLKGVKIGRNGRG